MKTAILAALLASACGNTASQAPAGSAPSTAVATQPAATHTPATQPAAPQVEPVTPEFIRNQWGQGLDACAGDHPGTMALTLELSAQGTVLGVSYECDPALQPITPCVEQLLTGASVSASDQDLINLELRFEPSQPVAVVRAERTKFRMPGSR